ncbi:hypothetical protein QTP70_010513 [Hemibagrus guttatus]|uniref:Ribonuclease A-domain domain-containing protein n=1 Tax=Hemibagrus guttatus TaxID=175788 RepID=A0AAE0PW97_9TELE|nr:hypothetical protein QTP70_010513 [Hemibagrus guttatus]
MEMFESYTKYTTVLEIYNIIMEMRVFGLVLLLVLSVALPAEAQNWQAFQRKHIYLRMTEPYCTRKIEIEHINPPGTCKYSNSFIKATAEQVMAICRGGGRPVGGNLYESDFRFNVVTCIQKTRLAVLLWLLQSSESRTRLELDHLWMPPELAQSLCDSGKKQTGNNSDQFSMTAALPVVQLHLTSICYRFYDIIMEMRVFGLVLLLVLSIALPAEAQTWREFRKKHIYRHMTEPYCTRKIKNENINPPGTCKYRNSFIKATAEQVMAICQNAGRRVHGNLYKNIIMEMRVFGLVLLLVLSVALPAEAQTWQAFQRKHIYLRMTGPDCTRKIEIENINPPGTCRPVNSFIKATAEQVMAICRGGGRPVGGNLYESDFRFNVVTCIQNTSTPCTYSGRQSPKYITVVCERGYPVHYQRERS